MSNEYYVRRIPFPNRSVKAATFPNDDGTFDIYLNTLYPEAVQQQALHHELEHIRLGHFYSEKSIEEKEAEADGAVPAEVSTKRSIPLFQSPGALGDWICSQ